MCGIFGWWNRDGAPPPGADAVRAATEVIAPRGPDDFGYLRDEASGMALGFRRLAIIDLDTGAQPMSREDRGVHLVFNGEIYNFQELRERLRAKGHVFHTKSDSEVILNGYVEWGEGVLDELCGMFAIAIWDDREQSLLLARDRLGIKPLYFARAGASPDATFAFASDPRCFLADGRFDDRVDPEALSLYLRHFYVPAPWTIFQQVRKLRPGELLRVDRQGQRSRRYWCPAFEPRPRSAARCLAEWNELFDTVVRQHLISDVPLGAFLSGGMDSTAVVQAASALEREPLLTFNVAFEDPRANEAPYARQAAEILGTRHRELSLESDPGEAMAAALAAFPEPFADTAATPNYLLSKVVRQHCTVALSGDGGDEVFGGYSLRSAQLLFVLKRLPGPLRRAVAAALRAPQLAPLSERDTVEWYSRAHTRTRDEIVSRLVGPELAAGAARAHDTQMRDWLAGVKPRGMLNPMLALDLAFGLPDQMLTKVDVTSMAQSLEMRVPFLDHRVVEFGGGLPSRMKQWGFGPRRSKRIVRAYLAQRFPASFIHRPKMGFGLPLTGALEERLAGLRAGDTSALPLPDDIDRAGLAQVVASADTTSSELYGLLALSAWQSNLEARPRVELGPS